MNGILRGFCFLAIVGVVSAEARAGDGKTYALDRCDVLRAIMASGETTDPINLGWAAENASNDVANAGAFVAKVGQYSASPSRRNVRGDKLEDLSRPESMRANLMSTNNVSRYRLTWYRGGRGLVRARYDYALGDRLLVPSGFPEVDWARTYVASAQLPGQDDAFLFSGSGDLADAVMYFARGGQIVVNWVLRNGEEYKRVYSVRDIASTRPYRLFRTDAPYNNDPISLAGKFVKIVGAASLFTLEHGTRETIGDDGLTTVDTNVVTRGVYLSSANNLHAVGDVSGQFLLAYYDSADYTQVLDVQVVEVCTPSVKVVDAKVGDELHPMADGYPTVGLYPEVVDSARTTRDGRGDFIYVHTPGASYLPHNNSAFALRPTIDSETGFEHRYDATINWYAPDELGVSWPFEQTQYRITWGTGVTNLISGNISHPGQAPVFPESWTVTPCDYQEPDGNMLSDLTWCKAGRSLLKIDGVNAEGLADVAFVQVDTVLAGSLPVATNSAVVGRRIVPTSPAAACVTNTAGRTWLGYIHEPWSATCYDADAYVAPTADGLTVDDGETEQILDVLNGLLSFDSGTGTATVERVCSDLFFVNVPEPEDARQVLDVWWNVCVRTANLQDGAYFPAIRECFKPSFPDPDETEQIVLASQKGSSGVSVWGSVWHTNEIIVADTLPHVYAGGTNAVDSSGVGWNPNVTHAFCLAGDGGYVCWAYRCDMKTHSSLEHPLVYVKGTVTDELGLPELKVWTYYVLETNEAYPSFEGDMLVANQLPGPHPLDLENDPWLPEIWWDSNMLDPSKNVAYRDRKGVVWARRDGNLPIHMYYANKSEFSFTFQQKNRWRTWTVDVPSGTPLPWNCTLVANEVTNSAPPRAWTWHAVWPENSPMMQIGRTLTKAADMLPEVWGAASASVLWPDPNGLSIGSSNAVNDVAQLVDPTRAQTTSLAAIGGRGVAGAVARGEMMSALGFSSDPGGNCVERNGCWYFRDVPTSISTRFYYDPNADIRECLVLEGRLDEPSGGIATLYMNVLNDTERAALKALVPSDNKYAAEWAAAIDKLAVKPVYPTAATYAVKRSQSGHTYLQFESAYSPVDHYALTTPGGGGAFGATNWVVWIENDAAPGSGLSVQEGDAVSMHVLKVVPEYYLGQSVTRTDENNLLSQLLDVVYTDPLGGRGDQFFFEWQRAEPQANGELPTEGDWRDAGRSGPGLTRFTLGSQGTMADLVNTYYRVRYRANAGTTAATTMGTSRWSDWTSPCLAEGWIQRVINSITPFTQRVTDLYENPPETTVSMLRQIGRPYQGDVALNMDNLTEVGLLEMYMTLLNKAESMSISMGSDASIDVTGVNKQLMQLVERLDDFYALLGNEAFSDAANPTIACSDTSAADSGAAGDYVSTGLFSFDNQVPTLLDEELALLRGRDVLGENSAAESAASYRAAPCYNRLLWNFTRGITAGEVAYAMNYNIQAEGDALEVDAESAAVAYPQGHGDAWGHYLNGLKLWYRLLRNPSFSWSVSMGEMNVADHPINVDYFEERKMAEAAASLGKTAERVVDLTARKTWRDRGGALSAAEAGYEDKVASRGFGYGEWGNRGGIATFANWMVANSLLPAAETNGTLYTDTGLLVNDRSTVTALKELANSYDRIQRKVDQLNANLNPLGFADNTVPFGISPAAADGSDSHFEQTLAGAKTALKNADALLKKASESTARLRKLTQEAREAEQDAEQEEADFNKRLIALYGYPYAGDIGVGKTYPQGYEGPDLYHWMYVDLLKEQQSKLNGSLEEAYTVSIGYKWNDITGNGDSEKLINLSFDYSRVGLVIKPSSVTGERRAWGELQYAYEEYLAAIQAFLVAFESYENTREEVYILAVKELTSISTMIGMATACIPSYIVLNKRETEAKKAYDKFREDALFDAILGSNVRVSTLGNAYFSTFDYESSSFSLGLMIGSGASLTRTTGAESAKAKFADWVTQDPAEQSRITTTLENALATYKAAEKEMKKFEAIAGILKVLIVYAELGFAYYEGLTQYCQQLNKLGESMILAFAKIAPLAEKVLTLKAEGEAILNEREAARVRRAQAAATSRYADMAHRLWRDEALDTYAQSYDIAQKYTWLAAKAYDYETGGQITAGGEGSEFLDAIVGTRLPGELQADGSPMRRGTSGDAGLSDILARMEENWYALKKNLGINNPQTEMTWFSLRTEAFRLLPGADGLNAWRNKLDSYRVSSLRNQPSYDRLCQSLRSEELDEPAIVIPLGSTIDFAKNFFGRDLAGGDHQFSPTYFATKIAEVGVELVGYNVGRDGGKVTSFAETPYVYLVPAGFDRMRAPATGEVLTYDVADQVLPMPNLIGSATLNASWDALYETLSGQTAGQLNVRRYPAFRANGTSNASTLIGRSVWNTEWVLVIPGGSLRSDRIKALEELIWGNDETPGITDIKLGFRTYSHWGK